MPIFLLRAQVPHLRWRGTESAPTAECEYWSAVGLVLHWYTSPGVNGPVSCFRPVPKHVL